MDRVKEKKLSDILFQFNRQIKKLFKMVDSLMPDNPNVDWARRVIKYIEASNPNMIIERCLDKLWDNKDHIRTRDAEFFKSASMSKYIKNDGNKEWLDRLVHLVKTKYYDLKEKEKVIFWDTVNKMLELSIEYRIAQSE